MNLTQFQKQTGESDATLAVKWNIPQPTLWRIRTGRVVPRADTAARIETASGGQVTAMELLFPDRQQSDNQAA